MPHPLWRGRQGQARRIPLPRCDGQPLSRLCGAADGRPRRHPEQDPSGRSDGQEPLRPAAGRAGRGADRLRFAARSARMRWTADHDFLLKGGVFTKDQIDAYIELKWEEVMRWEMTPSRRSNSTCITLRRTLIVS